MDLFDRSPPPPGARAARAPLADRMRPASLDEVVGQEDLTGPGGFLRVALEAGEIPSMILWGPPGSGKTTIAHVVACATSRRFEPLSAVTSGVADVRRIIDAACKAWSTEGRGTILFVDEIHRFNKAQQDAFLPHVEAGTITLIGATTENPSVSVIGPLLSRAQVVPLRALPDDAIVQIVRRTLSDAERGLGSLGLSIDEDAIPFLSRLAGGDARTALNLVETVAAPLRRAPATARRITAAALARAVQRPTPRHDRTGDRHFDLISAFHKSLRASDADATLYWLARMLEGGEDPVYVGRRLIRAASEDVGNADPRALPLAVAAVDAVRLIGMPEGALALAQAAVYVALAPKSNATYLAYEAARRDAADRPDRPVPLAIRNAPTPLARDLGHGEGYKYAHDYLDAIVPLICFPPDLAGRRYYHPRPAGDERELARRMEEIEAVKRAVRDPEAWRAPDGGPPGEPPSEGANEP